MKNDIVDSSVKSDVEFEKILKEFLSPLRGLLAPEGAEWSSLPPRIEIETTFFIFVDFYL